MNTIIYSNNMSNDVVLLSKKDPSVWDKIESVLPQNFDDILKEIRVDTAKRFKKLGIIHD